MVDQISFSPCGQYLGYSSGDGRLKFWETNTGALYQEYTPSSHLTTTCTCLSWAPIKRVRERLKKDKKLKKKQRYSDTSRNESDVVAMGTCSGAILLYSIVKAELQCKMDDGHSESVNGVEWDVQSDSLYSCSSDQHLVHWSLSTGKAKYKWKGGTTSIYSVCLSPDKKQLLSASRKIKLWDIDTRQPLQVFSGHASEVFRLLSVNVMADALDDFSKTFYFLSAAVGDRMINAWQVSETSNVKHKNKNAIAAFVLPDEPLSIAISARSDEVHPILLAAVTQQGRLHLYEQHLNGKCKAPIHPEVTLQVTISDNKRVPSKTVPVLGAHFLSDQDQTILLAHGSFIKPTFETLPYSSREPEIHLIRSDSSLQHHQVEMNVAKIKTPVTCGDVKTLIPNQMVSFKQNLKDKRAKKKQNMSSKEQKLSSKEISLGERVGIDMVKDLSANTELPKADNLAVLLTQGLQSQDLSMIGTVLANTKRNTIENTVKSLPLSALVPLVEELARRMKARPQAAQGYMQWVKSVLRIHMSYLSTFPELTDKLSIMYQILDSRLIMYDRISKLKGKLDLLLLQASDIVLHDKSSVNPEALLVYQEESEEEEDSVIGDLMQTSHSESEGNWEELSEGMEEENDAGPSSKKLKSKKRRKQHSSSSSEDEALG